MDEVTSEEVRLVEVVATKTAERVRAGLKEELDGRDESLRQLWRQDLAQLRDDLTAKALLAAEQGVVAEAAPVRVLVVDDHQEVLSAFVRSFSKAGMDVHEATNGVKAAELLSKDHLIEVVVADVAMPKNGYTLLEHVRKNFPSIEVVMISGYEFEVERARKLGAFGFLPKPFNLSQAVLLVERAAEFRRLKLLAAKG